MCLQLAMTPTQIISLNFIVEALVRGETAREPGTPATILNDLRLAPGPGPSG